MSKSKTQSDTEEFANNPQSTLKGVDEHNEHHYRCPYCKVTFNNEMLARVHVTRLTDEVHDTHNGLMPETAIEVVDDNGDVIRTISRQAEAMDVSELTIEDMPETLCERHKHIILVAARNPYETSYRQLTDMVKSHLKQEGIKVPSYSTVRRVLTNFFNPTDDSEAKPFSNLSELQPKQLAIVIQTLLTPDASYADIANKVECSRSYPAQVVEKTSPILDQLESAAGDPGKLEAILNEELSADDVKKLVEKEENFVDKLPISLSAGSDDERTEQWGSPVTEEKTLSAQPPTPFGENKKQMAKENAQNEVGVSETANEADSGSIDSSEQVTTDSVRALKEHMTFVSDVFANVDGTVDNALMVALSEEVEQRCDHILEDN